MNNILKAVATASIMVIGLAQNANATPITFQAIMTAAAENNPADTSTATGFSIVVLDGDTLFVTETWSG